MHGLSHGTQDLYPDFLKSVHGFTTARVSYIAMFYNVGAIIGGILFGHMSEKWGRRRAMMAAMGVSLCVMPAWAFGSTTVALALGAFVMQVGVQGAWGIIPAHLNEMAPNALRGLVPGFAYQVGILLAAPTNSIEYALRDRFGYSWALASFELMVIAALSVALLLGREEKGKSFVAETSAVATHG
jgi:SHS family lactate transporter-like MFS transporter